MEHVENEARTAGYLGVQLDTFRYQAPAFYASRGYVEHMVLNGKSPERDRIFMVKRFDAPTTDTYRVTDTLDDQTIDAMVARLEERGRDATFTDMLDQYLEAMSIDDASRVLDMGCGTGVVARRIAGRAGFAGLVTGIDLSPRLVEVATRLASDEGLSEATEFKAGDTRSLQLDSEGFDAAVAHTLLSHVPDPQAVLAEAARVLRPGGVIGVFDGDYASRTFQFSTDERSRKMENIMDTVVTQPRVLRRLPALAGAAGLELVASFPHVFCETGHADFYLSSIRSFATLGPKSGVITQEEADDWVAELETASDNGTFFGSTNYLAYVFRKTDMQPSCQ
jgi:ubiquinone/menaquinone biosynthesis C-methylase UbiE